jgi:hypothetical protein
MITTNINIHLLDIISSGRRTVRHRDIRKSGLETVLDGSTKLLCESRLTLLSVGRRLSRSLNSGKLRQGDGERVVLRLAGDTISLVELACLTRPDGIEVVGSVGVARVSA